MISKTVWPALGGSPLRFLRSSWPWRAVAYVVSSVALGSALLVVLGAMAVAGLITTPLVVGVLILVGLVLIGIPVAEVERRRLRLMVPGLAVGRVHSAPAHRGPKEWATARLRETRTWWELGYALLLAGPLWLLDLAVIGIAALFCFILLAAPWLMTIDTQGLVVFDWLVIDVPLEAWTATAVGVPVLVVTSYAITAYAGARAALARALLVPPAAELEAELVRATRSRARLVDAFDAERRRIERDLHDGAQQQLLGVSVELGLARLEVPDTLTDSVLVKRLDEAQARARQAMADLRALIHGIHPQILTDRGLPAAVALAADRLVVPVEIDLDLPRRLPAAVESSAYFAACEAFANIGKHSQATAVRVRGTLKSGLLRLEIWDNGVGGARAEAGSGLVGLVDRLAVVNGSMRLSSPPGGPTIVAMEIPCPPSE